MKRLSKLGKPGSKPNIFIIVSDALRARNLRLYGYETSTSPNLDRLAREGVVFLDAYATTDQTDPSFTTILSGRYPVTHGILRHGPEVTHEHVSTFVKTGTKLLPELLAKHGYVSFAVDWLDRWHKRGYHVYGTPSALMPRRILGRIGRAKSVVTRLLSAAPSWGAYRSLYRFFSRLGYSNDRLSPSIFDAALNLLRRGVRDGKPVFMLIHVWDTHTPFNYLPAFMVKKFYRGGCGETVEEMAGKIKNPEWRRVVLEYHLRGIRCVDEIEPRYNAAIYHFDAMLGLFIDELRDAGIYEDSIIVVTGDHGENLVRNGVFIGHGGLFQRVLRVPLVITAPSILPEGKRLRGYVQHTDLVPTLLGLAGIDSSGYIVDGVDVEPLIFDSRPVRGQVFAVSSTAPKRYALIEGRYKLVYSPSPRDAADKYGIWYQAPVELYDLERDGDDVHNLAESMPDIVRDMEERLREKLSALHRKRVSLILKSRPRRGGRGR